MLGVAIRVCRRQRSTPFAGRAPRRCRYISRRFGGRNKRIFQVIQIHAINIMAIGVSILNRVWSGIFVTKYLNSTSSLDTRKRREIWRKRGEQEDVALRAFCTYLRQLLLSSQVLRTPLMGSSCCFEVGSCCCFTRQEVWLGSGVGNKSGRAFHAITRQAFTIFRGHVLHEQSCTTLMHERAP